MSFTTRTLEEKLVSASTNPNDMFSVKMYVEEGANIHHNDCRAMRFAAHAGNWDVVWYFLDLGADIHADDDFLVKKAAEKGELELVKRLIKLGAHIHDSNKTAIKLAKSNGHTDVVWFINSLSEQSETPC